MTLVRFIIASLLHYLVETNLSRDAFHAFDGIKTQDVGLMRIFVNRLQENLFLDQDQLLETQVVVSVRIQFASILHTIRYELTVKTDRYHLNVILIDFTKHNLGDDGCMVLKGSHLFFILFVINLL